MQVEKSKEKSPTSKKNTDQEVSTKKETNSYLPKVNKQEKKFQNSLTLKEGFQGGFLKQPKFEKLHEINKKFCNFMSKNGEYEWQKFRKKRNQVSNILKKKF